MSPTSYQAALPRGIHRNLNLGDEGDKWQGRGWVLVCSAQFTDHLEPLTLHGDQKALLEFLHRVPTAETAQGRKHWTSSISWADKVMSPHNLFIRESDGRIVLGLDKPGPELKGSRRGGDEERVALVRFTKAGPMEVEIKNRQEILDEERREKEKKSKL